MNSNTASNRLCIFGPLLIGLVTPSLVMFFLAVFVGHVSPHSAAIDILQRQFAKGHNLFLIALFGLIPLTLYSG